MTLKNIQAMARRRDLRVYQHKVNGRLLDFYLYSDCYYGPVMRFQKLDDIRAFLVGAQ